MTERADQIYELALAWLDQEALNTGLSDGDEALRILLHNVRDVPDRAWARAMERVAAAFLSPAEVAALPGRPPEAGPI